jgi:alkaline phosphatase
MISVSVEGKQVTGMQVFTILLLIFSSVANGYHDEWNSKVVNSDRDGEWGEDDPRWDTEIPNWWDEENFVPPVGPVEERSKDFWMEKAQNSLKEKLSQKLNLNKAKNLVIFIGDGMGISTQMATRVYKEDVRTELSFEKFPHTGLSKTYCINYQVPDSACTANAILSGFKNNYATLGVTGEVNLRECSKQQDNSTHVDSIFKFAQDAGKATGIVTNTRVTHATPAAAYAHTSSRYWESNENTPEGCDDIAHQLIHGEVGSKFDVVMGGGRRHFLPVGATGRRTDGRNLISEYVEMQQKQQSRFVYVENRVRSCQRSIVF